MTIHTHSQPRLGQRGKSWEVTLPDRFLDTERWSFHFAHIARS